MTRTAPFACSASISEESDATRASTSVPKSVVILAKIRGVRRKEGLLWVKKHTPSSPLVVVDLAVKIHQGQEWTQTVRVKQRLDSQGRLEQRGEGRKQVVCCGHAVIARAICSKKSQVACAAAAKIVGIRTPTTTTKSETRDNVRQCDQQRRRELAVARQILGSGRLFVMMFSRFRIR